MDILSNQAKLLLLSAKKIANENKSKYCNTEHLFLAMYNLKESICRFLLNELDIKEEDITKFIPKNTKEVDAKITYSDEVVKLINDATKYAKSVNSKLVYDEHIFYTMLCDKKCKGYKVMIKLKLDIDRLKEDVCDVFDWEIENKFIENKFLTNFTKLAHEKATSKLVGRTKAIDRIGDILKRKTKSNVILVGSAGVGKTTIVEGYAKKLYTQGSSAQVLSLDVSALIAGTKYRGDFESRLNNIIKLIQSNKEIILFIDEIHNIVGAGKSEGSLDISNILKPFLARNDFKVIGATTTSEYNKHITKDKALTRRFIPIFVEEPNLKETITILKGIKKSYEIHHKLKVPNSLIQYIVEQSELIDNRKQPDKAIDLLDESMSLESTNTLRLSTINKSISNITNIPKDINKLECDYKYNFKEYLLRYILSMNKNNICTINYKGNNIDSLLAELTDAFSLSTEMILKINLLDYTDHHSLSNLIGSPKGYVGYSEGGVLTNHLRNYPINIICLNNFSKSNQAIKSYFRGLFEQDYILDQLGNKTSLKNTIFILDDNSKTYSNIGYSDNVENKDSTYDITIIDNDVKIEEVTYLDRLKQLGYDIDEYTNINDYKGVIDLLLSSR